METFSIELPEGVSFDTLNVLARSCNVELSISQQRNFDAMPVLNMLGTIASLLSFAMEVSRRYGQRRVITTRITDSEGEMEERPIDYFIDYLENKRNNNKDNV